VRSDIKAPLRFVELNTVTATKSAWRYKFQGNANIVLRKTIEDRLNMDRNSYARLTWIVNSSGTGKSRMVDELGTEIITVPMCLRQAGSTGFAFSSFFMTRM
jgi:hypothetical protein